MCMLKGDPTDRISIVFDLYDVSSKIIAANSVGLCHIPGTISCEICLAQNFSLNITYSGRDRFLRKNNFNESFLSSYSCRTYVVRVEPKVQGVH
jgi:hypothetical protein